MTLIETARRFLAKLTDTNIMDFRKGNLDDIARERIKQASEVVGEVWNITIKNVLYTSEVKKYILKS
jgi:hypothetical protein